MRQGLAVCCKGSIRFTPVVRSPLSLVPSTVSLTRGTGHRLKAGEACRRRRRRRGTKLETSSSRCLDLFALFDEDSNGEITKDEFRKVIRAFGFKANNDELDAVFDALDFVDHSGTLSYLELNKTLRMTDPLPENATAREIAISAHMQHPLRRATDLEVAPHAARAVSR